MAKTKKAKKANGTDLGFEATLWLAADKLRSNMDAAEYKHVVLGLIFLKYISDAFEEKHTQLASKKDEGYDPEDRDEYTADNIFWVPKEARWSFLQSKAKQPDIGTLIDDANVAVERDNPRLKGILPKDYARPALDKRRLGELIDLIGTIGLGSKEDQSKDVLGRVYEYFLSRFASAEGKNGGEFYTPRCIVDTLVTMLAPTEKSRIYDPCCGSGGMFVQSERFIEHHGGRVGAIAIYGQEMNHTTWRLCNMNLAIRGIEGHITQGDTFHSDGHKDLKSDFVLSNPPFNISDWGGEGLRDDARWTHGVPPSSNANFAWIQHFLHHLAPNGTAGFVLANGSLVSNQSGEGRIRTSIAEADLVDCIVALPGQLFYATPIPVSLWFLTRNKGNSTGYRARNGETLFIDARKLGEMVGRTHRELSEDEVADISSTYHSWRGDKNAPAYRDIPGYCGSVSIDDIRSHGYSLTPGRYVGIESQEDDGPPFVDRMAALTSLLQDQIGESDRLNSELMSELKRIS
jgi:type I restriction enzyme M protein